jgi:hypothetical protein
MVERRFSDVFPLEQDVLTILRNAAASDGRFFRQTQSLLATKTE